MADEKIPKQTKGVIEEKQEKTKKDGLPFWKFKINGNVYSCFDYDMGKEVSLNEEVGIIYTENEKEIQGKPIIFRNITSIVPVSEIDEDTTNTEVVTEEKVTDNKQTNLESTQTSKSVLNSSQEEYKAMEANKYVFGMAFNNACLIVSQAFAKVAESNPETKFDEEWENAVINTTKRLHKVCKETRKELEGY